MQPLPRPIGTPARRRFALPAGGGCLVPLGIVAATLIALVVLFGQLRATFDPALRQQQRLEALRQYDVDSRLEWLDTLVAAGWKLLPLALVAGASFVALGIAWRRWGQHKYIQAHHVTALTRAQTQRFPAALQSLSFHDSSKQIPPAVVEQPAMLPSPVSVPTFRAALETGAIGLDGEGRAQPLILAYDAASGEPIEGSWKDLYSVGVGALQGAGKSWLEAFLLSQSALAGAKLIIADPHAGHNSESLAARIKALQGAFLCDVAQSDAEILDALQLANDELERRKSGKGASFPVVVCIDEWTSLLRGELGQALPAFVTNFAEQGRKFNVNALLSAQGWTKDAAGIVRNRLTSHYVLRQRQDEARYQLGLRAAQMPDDIRMLPDATGYLLTVRGGFTKVVIPRMTPADLEIVGTQLGATPRESGRPFGFQPTRKPSPAETNGKATGSQKESKARVVSSPSESDLPNGITARILALFLSGLDIPAIVREVYGTTAGREYQARRLEVETIIRDALKVA
jgi:hypothetical protein